MRKKEFNLYLCTDKSFFVLLFPEVWKITNHYKFQGGFIMKKTYFVTAFLLILVVSFVSCNEKNIDKLLSDDQISANLARSGSFDPALLVGEWNIVRFAYTADGKSFSDVATVSSASLSVRDTFDENHARDCGFNPEYLDIGVILSVWNSSGYFGSLSGYLINFKFCGSTLVYVAPPHEEFDIGFAIDNARSFVIRGDELIIYFKGDDEGWKDFFKFQENKNLLILERREV